MDNQLLSFARLALGVARRILPERLSKFARPAYPPASLLACLLLKEHLRMTYRAMEDLLQLSGRLRRLFRLTAVPDHSTIWWFARRHLSPKRLAAGLAETVRRVSADKEYRQVALDSTGLWLSHLALLRLARQAELRSARLAEVGHGDVDQATTAAGAAGPTWASG